jgi:hypothetical protein
MRYDEPHRNVERQGTFVGELESSDSVGLMVIHKTENAKKNSV